MLQLQWKPIQMNQQSTHIHTALLMITHRIIMVNQRAEMVTTPRASILSISQTEDSRRGLIQLSEMPDMLLMLFTLEKLNIHQGQQEDTWEEDDKSIRDTVTIFSLCACLVRNSHSFKETHRKDCHWVN